MPRQLTHIILTVVVAVLCTVSALPASAATPTPAEPSPTEPPTAPVSLTVSTPADPLPIEPGQVLQTWLRIGNNGTAPLAVTITRATVAFGNNGATSLSSQADPHFADHITLSTTTATIAAGGFTEVQVTISVPTTLVPDTYVLGFLVTPTVTGGSVQVVNQVGALITLDLPGSRDRRLEATFLDPPLFSLTSHPSFIVRVRNIGRSALEFTSETSIDGVGFRLADTDDIRGKSVLLPAGTYRDIEVKWELPGGAGIFQLPTQLLYHRSQAETVGESVTHTVVVVSPVALAIMVSLLIVIVAAIFWILLRRRRARQRTQQGHGRRIYRRIYRPTYRLSTSPRH